MLNDMSIKTYIIRHKDTKKLFIAPSGKSSWRSTGAAKNAFAQMGVWDCSANGLTPIVSGEYGSAKMRPPLFKEQDVYEVVELNHEIEDRMVMAEKLLVECLAYASWDLSQKILDFIGEKDADN